MTQDPKRTLKKMSEPRLRVRCVSFNEALVRPGCGFDAALMRLDAALV